MQDRVPVNPGRVLVTPENGGAAYYATLTRADNPTQEGTVLNRATLLTDAVAAMYGKGASAVPNDIFAYLGKYAQHWWWRKSLATATRYRLAETSFSSANDYVYFLFSGTIYTADEVAVDAVTGKMELVNPVVVSNNVLYGSLLGKYLQSADGIVEDYYGTNVAITDIIHVADSVSGTSGGANFIAFEDTYVKICIAEAYQADVGTVDYLQSPDSTAYPHSGNDGAYEYQYLGRPFDNAVTVPDFEIISYTGTGTYGADNPNSITFSRAPKLIIMIGERATIGNLRWYQLGANEEDWIYMLPTEALSTEFEAMIGFGNNANGGVYGKKSKDGKTISWYNSNRASWQYNDSYSVYYLLALFDGGACASCDYTTD